MVLESLFEKTAMTFGFNALLVLIIGYGSYKLIRYVFEKSDDREKRLVAESFEREKRFLGIIDLQTTALKDNTDRMKELQSEASKVAQFQRSEHERILENQKQLGEDHRRHTEVLQNLVTAAEGTKDAVARINGYKKEE